MQNLFNKALHGKLEPRYFAHPKTVCEGVTSEIIRLIFTHNHEVDVRCNTNFSVYIYLVRLSILNRENNNVKQKQNLKIQ